LHATPSGGGCASGEPPRAQIRSNGAFTSHSEAPPMKGILLWLIGIPIPIIILLYLFNVF
jgi:hypothetical protein